MKYSLEIKEFNQKNKRIQKLILLSKIVNSKKIILTILEQESSILKILLEVILKFLHIKEKISLSSSPKQNLKKIKKIISNEWKLKKEIVNSAKLFDINKMHLSSTMEFVRKNNIIIMDEKENIETINLNKLIQFSKDINKIKQEFQKRI